MDARCCPALGRRSGRLAGCAAGPQDNRFTATADGTSLAAYETALPRGGGHARGRCCAGGGRSRWDVAWEECEAQDGFVIHGKKRLTLRRAGAKRRPATIRPIRRRCAPSSCAKRRSRAIRPAQTPDLSPARPAVQGRWQLPVRRRRAAARHGLCRDPPRARSTAPSSPAFDKDARPARPACSASSRASAGSRCRRRTWWAAEQALEALAPQLRVSSTPLDSARIEDALDEAVRNGEAQRDRRTRRWRRGAGTPSPRWRALRRRARRPRHDRNRQRDRAAARTGGSNCGSRARRPKQRAHGRGQGARHSRTATWCFTRCPPAAASTARLEHDHAIEAALIAREAGRPVQLTWSRWQEACWPGCPRTPVAAAARRAQTGRQTARSTAGARGLRCRPARRNSAAGCSATSPRWAAIARQRGRGRPAGGGRRGAALCDRECGDRARAGRESACRPARLRGNAHGYTAFFIESFIDELAHAARSRAAVLTAWRCSGTTCAWPHACSARRSWPNGTAARDQSGQGLACHRHRATAGSRPHRLRRHRARAKAGCASTSSPRRSISAAIVNRRHRPPADRGRADVRPRPRARLEHRLRERAARRAGRLAELGLPLLADCPEIEVDFIASEAPPADPGELGVAVAAPAIANALFSATGLRLRRLPLLSDGIYETLASARPASDDHPPVTSGRIGVLLVNLGTPDAPTPAAVQRYLAEFLSDRRVVEIPPLAWQPILRGIILNTRPKKIAHAYAQVWTEEGSPLAAITAAQARGAAAAAGRCGAGRAGRCAMAIRRSRSELAGADGRTGCERILLAPLYPQYCGGDHRHAWSTRLARRAEGACAGSRRCARCRPITTIPPISTRWREDLGAQLDALDFAPEVLLLSFHGMPERTLHLGDPYHCHCRKTARLLAEALAADARACGSRPASSRASAAAKWLEPATDAGAGAEEAGKGTKRLAVAAPGFSADCLETLRGAGDPGARAVPRGRRRALCRARLPQCRRGGHGHARSAGAARAGGMGLSKRALADEQIYFRNGRKACRLAGAGFAGIAAQIADRPARCVDECGRHACHRRRSMPSVSADLGGYAAFSWAVAGFLIGSVIAGASAGRVAEIFGLGPASSVAGMVFAVGCAIGRAAPDMCAFLVGRLVQGMGSGWFSGFAMVAIAQLFPERQLARVFRDHFRGVGCRHPARPAGRRPVRGGWQLAGGVLDLPWPGGALRRARTRSAARDDGAEPRGAPRVRCGNCSGRDRGSRASRLRTWRLPQLASLALILGGFALLTLVFAIDSPGPGSAFCRTARAIRARSSARATCRSSRSPGPRCRSRSMCRRSSSSCSVSRPLEAGYVVASLALTWTAVPPSSSRMSYRAGKGRGSASVPR